MAEERNVGAARATETTLSDDETTKQELQRRMEQARESITQTVSEIKDTVSTQYQSVREGINDALDWREQYRKRPVAFHIGAVSVGFLVGYGLASASSNGRRRDDYSVFDVSEVDEDYEDDSDAPKYQTYSSKGYAVGGRSGAPVSYARQTYAAVEPAASTGDKLGDTQEPQKPGLVERFKETKAFDRLQQEVGSLGDRFVDELSHTAQAVVLPALLGKLKDMMGIDLGAQQKEAKRSTLEQQSTEARNSAMDAVSTT